jgi:carbon-monoxide dehydrogenase small subunit
MPDHVNITLVVNGKPATAAVEPRLMLADFLRERLRLTGTHLGCEHGACGACTVLLDGRTVCACLMLAVQADGCSILTIEGLSPADALAPLQQSFRRHHALQCGFCTPGMLMSAHALLAENPRPSRDQIREAISGNLCRCTGYVPIVEAIHDVAHGTGAAVEGNP